MPQSERALVELHAPEELLFRSMTAVESLGQPFEMQVVALADEALAQPADMLAKPVALGVALADDSRRWFHGLVGAVGLEGMVGRRYAYRLSLRPWLWLAGHRADIRIFQNQSVDEIVKKVLQEFSGDFRFDLEASYAPVEYCVQYRESDLDFVSRLMEHEGIYYYFEHERDKHTMVITDATSTHRAAPGYASFAYRHGLLDASEGDCIGHWTWTHELRPTKATLQDYEFTKPGQEMLRSHDAGTPYAPQLLEVYDWPGRYATPDAGGRLAELRAQERQSMQAHVAGGGTVRALACGARFSLDDPPPHGEGEYVAVSTRIDVSSGGPESDEGEARFACSFSAIESGAVFRPARLTPRPTAGPQTATVVGPSGEEIHTDEHGRVKLHFHWDRLGQRDENSSCWVRVAQPLAGDGFGMVALPRIGQEVVVDFLEGDPDRPVVVGRLYNGTHSTPYKLPDHKTVTTFKSRSSKGGSADTFNELRFEDEKGHEYVWLHAEKDLVEVVEKDARLTVGNDQYRSVEKDLSEEIKENVDRSIGKDLRETIGSNLNLTVGQDVAAAVGGKYGLEVSGDLVLETGANHSLKTGANSDTKAGANVAVDAGGSVHIKGALNVVIEAGVSITLKAGGGSVVIGPANVSITGAMVMINSGGGGGSGAGAKPRKPKAPQEPKKLEKHPDPQAHIKG